MGTALDADAVGKQQRTRSSNIELMRIFLMLGIIMHHLVVNSGISGEYDITKLPVKMLYCQLAGNYGKTIINCFTLITGYYMVKSHITVKKFLQVYLQYKFYYILFYLIFVITGYEPLTMKGAMLTVFSLAYECTRRYSGTYIVFFLFIPFVNILAREMSKRQYQLLLGLCLTVFTVIPTLSDYYFGFSTYNFLGFLMVTYLIGGYIRLYPCRYFESCRFALISMIALLAVSSAFILFVDFYGYGMGFKSAGYLVYDCNKPIAVALAVAVFLFFKNLKIRNHKWINILARSTFGVLLIHTNSDVMRRFLWRTLFHCVEHYRMGFKVFFPFSIAAILSVYLVCVLIDMLRIQLLEKPLMARLGRRNTATD